MDEERKAVAARLRELELRGGSHQMLSAICACVRPAHHGWTERECRALAAALADMLDGGAGGRED